MNSSESPGRKKPDQQPRFGEDDGEQAERAEGLDQVTWGPPARDRYSFDRRPSGRPTSYSTCPSPSSSSSRPPRPGPSPASWAAATSSSRRSGTSATCPGTPTRCPPPYKGEPWARLGVDVDNDFKPLYVVAKEKKQVVTKLKQLLKDADELYLATDEDREGESIAWHLLEVLSPAQAGAGEADGVPRDHRPAPSRPPSTTPATSTAGWSTPRRPAASSTASTATRCRPSCGSKVLPKLSAGRVQSVATRILVERERARMRFRPRVATRDVEGTFAKPARPPAASAPPWSAVDGTRLATGKDFDETGQLGRAADVVVLDDDGGRGPGRPPGRRRLHRAVGRGEALPAQPVPAVHDVDPPAGGGPQAALHRPAHHVDRPAPVRERLHHLHAHRQHHPVGDGGRRRPAPGGRALRPRLRARPAPALREEGQERPGGARGHPPRGRHASARPTRWPGELGADERGPLRADLEAHGGVADGRRPGPERAGAPGRPRRPPARTPSSPPRARSSSSPGFLRAYVEGSDDPEADLEDREVRLPAAGRRATPSTPSPSSPRTTPPSRRPASPRRRWSRPWRSWASAGRRPTPRSSAPSRTGATSGRRARALVPSFTAFAVVTLLERHFADLVDYAFTARMEDDLDSIASGGREAVPWLSRFYFGNGDGPGLKAHGERPPRRDRPPRGQLHPHRHATPRAARSWCGWASTGPTCPATARTAPRPRGHRARRAHRREGRGAAGRRPAATGCSAPTRPAGLPVIVRDGPLRALRAAGRRRRRRPRPSPGRRRCSSAWRSTRSPSTTPCGCSPSPGSLGADPADGAGDHRPERPLRALRQEGHREPQPGGRGPAVHRHPRRGPAPCWPSPSARGGRAAAAAPLRELGADPVSGEPVVGARRAGSGPTSPTARPTRRSGRATRSRRSPSSGRPSCSRPAGTGARPSPARPRPRKAPPRRRPPRPGRPGQARPSRACGRPATKAAGLTRPVGLARRRPTP